VWPSPRPGTFQHHLSNQKVIGLQAMKKAITGLLSICALFVGVYFAAGKWAIRHETLDFFDAARQRLVAVNLAVRPDYEMKANAG
jgi:predicted transporter